MSPSKVDRFTSNQIISGEFYVVKYISRAETLLFYDIITLRSCLSRENPRPVVSTYRRQTPFSVAVNITGLLRRLSALP